MKQDKTIEQLAEALRDAKEQYDAVHAEYESVRSRQTAAMNRLNDAQREFDAGVAAMRKGAPWDSDWHRSNRKGGPVS